MKPTIPELVEKLAAQGDAYQIALHLEDQGVKGLRQSADHCVISEYLREQSGVEFIATIPEWAVMSYGEDGKIHFEDCGGEISWTEVDEKSETCTSHSLPLPDALNRLANSFDRGDFPALHQDAGRC